MRGCRRKKTSKETQEPNNPKALEELVKTYLSDRHENDAFPGMGEKTDQEWHDVYLTSLDGITDFICGKNNNIKVPDGPPYKFDTHQWPLRCKSRQRLVNKIADSLKNIGNSEYVDFEALMQEVEKSKVEYFGDTAKYDFALRYGWKKGIRPEKYVYVHSKPGRAAQHLVDGGYLSEIQVLERRLPLEKYKELLLPGMTAHDVEHFLCVFHDAIKKL